MIKGNPNINVTIGIIGGGQLGKMMAQSAKRQGYRVAILDPQEDCPASQVSDWHIVSHYNDTKALCELSNCCDVITYEFENVDCQAIIDTIPADKFPQGIKTLRISQDRLLEKEFLKTHGFPVGQYEAVLSKEDLQQAIANIGYPCVLKTTRFGYDGKGQVVLISDEDIQKAETLVSQTICVLEAFVPFEKEVSIMISRNLKGQTSVFPVSENHHIHNILHTTIVPARLPDDVLERVQEIAERIADALQLVGTLGIEFFVTADNQCYVNELAPRPHNSGHYSIEACNMSQFDVSIQAVLQLPMPVIKLYSSVVMINVLGQHVDAVFALKKEKPNWHFHDYGKLESKVNRKMGHVTVLSEDVEETLREIKELEIWE
ncbi:5-(carboxyamino)imidazole ribonucleotide synthase [Carnobacteriaceae bacterium zg-84]|uniref:5-(carboxyamino)imidazole ribonucleotide synthase n=1 Tax=Granulicatella sp. zg-84 TaxID=2678503 RepID=UPI0013C0543E|nr:5-(carboxyamino)imidazole ribonucleotide synthase [Granulicatella sp. zg-84]NEW66006.1 5-(carboxyamino)imidazole ribonucleotide synthase [Granulicatella sp. zg-84]QMI85850.1 5-(carboxyamino)imidazole ribonucleotide synthase [Carnobacteriaceae bacterium zg-84]